MGNYPAYICRNGHAVSTLSLTCHDKYCAKCGAPVSSRCPSCNSTIRGRSDENVMWSSKYIVPAYCRDCGKPYPWTTAAIEATVCMLQESDIPSEDQNKLIDILPDAITETPKTQLAAFRFQKAIATGGAFVAEGLRQFAIDFGCELLKKKVGL